MAPAVKERKQPTGPKKRRKKPKKKLKPRKLCLKTCWLQTPEDWARFNAWAAINALPRKPPDPEPIERPSKPLKYLARRLRSLSAPTCRNIPAQCTFRAVCKAALKAKPSKRLKRLAQPVCRDEPEDCREWCVSRAALRYKPSAHVIRLSFPVERADPEDCRDTASVSRAALKRKPSEKDTRLAEPKRFATTEECAVVERKKEPVEMSEWMEFLAVPAYRVLKDQTTDNAIKYKEYFLCELETRSKRAYEEQMRRRAEKKRREEEKRRRQEEEEKQRHMEAAGSEKGEGEDETDGREEGDEECLEEEEEKAEETQRAPKKFRPVFEDDPVKRAFRKAEKEKWRFSPSIECKEFPPKIPESAMTYQASEAIQRMAKPKEYKSTTCKEPFAIKKTALTAEASPRVVALAQPKHQAEPVQRPPPREKDEFGRPIIPKPEYGKKLPERKPYVSTRSQPDEKEKEAGEQEEGDGEEAEGGDKETLGRDEQTEEELETKEEKKPMSRELYRLANAATIDPIFDPVGAERQLRARKRAADEKSKENGDEYVDASSTDENEKNNENNEETEEA